MLVEILIFVVILIIILIVVIATRPGEFIITRALDMNAPDAKIFEQVNNMHNWEAWSPWAKLDPQATTTYSGPDAGVGASMKWSGNNKVGEGSNTIIESEPSSLIKMRLDFLRPMKATNYSEFNFTQDGDKTLVSWNMTGTNSFIGKAVTLFMNCDKMVGDMYDKGLANIKNIVEAK